MKLMTCLILLWTASFSRGVVIQGALQWSEDLSAVTNNATFSFDTALQSGCISNFWADENGTFTEEGFLADGNYDFSVSESVSTYDELTDFSQVMWSIYEERVISAKVEDVSGTLDSGRYEMIHRDYLMGGGMTRGDGSFSVIPEPASVFLLVLGFVGVTFLRKARCRQSNSRSISPWSVV